MRYPMGKYYSGPLLRSTDLLEPDPSTNPIRPKTILLRFDPIRGTVDLTTRHNDSSCPINESNRLVLVWRVDPVVDAQLLTAALGAGEIGDLLDRIRGGFSVERKGNNQVGVLSEDAQQAYDVIQRWLDDEVGTLFPGTGWCEADDWYADGTPPVAADMDEEEVEGVIASEEQTARENDVVVPDLATYIRNY